MDINLNNFEYGTLNIVAFNQKIVINKLVKLFGNTACYLNTPSMELENYNYFHIEENYLNIQISLFKLLKDKIRCHNIVIIGLSGLSFNSIENFILKIFTNIDLKDKLVILLNDDTNQLLFENPKFISITKNENFLYHEWLIDGATKRKYNKFNLKLILIFCCSFLIFKNSYAQTENRFQISKNESILIKIDSVKTFITIKNKQDSINYFLKNFSEEKTFNNDYKPFVRIDSSCKNANYIITND